MFRQFFDTSFNDYRQVRIVLQELSPNQSKQTSADFQRFCSTIFHHKSYTYEQFKVKYCYVKASLTLTEACLFDVQLYRRPFAFLLFTVVQTGEELQRVLDEYTKIREQEKDIFIHLFVQYKSLNNQFDYQLMNGAATDDYSNHQLSSSRRSFSSMISMDTSQSTNNLFQSAKFQDTISVDGSGSSASDRISLSDSFNGSSATFHTGQDDENDESSDTVGVILRPSIDQPKVSRLSLLKEKATSSNNLFQMFENDLTRVLHRLEMSLTKYLVENNRFNSKTIETFSSLNDSQLIDIRLMMDCENNGTLLENQTEYHHDKNIQAVLIEFDMRIMLNLLNHYLKANNHINNEFTKNKISKKILDARTIKRKADCCFLLGAIDKAYSDYRNVADVFKSQNDHIWHAASLEGRIAASYVLEQKPKRQTQRQTQFFKQNSLLRKFPVDKYFNRSNTPMNLKDRMELALQIYTTANRGTSNKATFRMELDVCLRWCSLLWEQNDIKKYRDDIDQYIIQINRLGSFLEDHIDSIYLNAYLAETYASIGLKRKSALYYRSAAYSGLCLITEDEGYNDEIEFFYQLIKQARKGYGIEDNQVIFPLIQKTIINESIQLSIRKDDSTTIIADVHFAIETLVDYMSDAELEALLTFLNASKQSIACSYCSIPRLKSIDVLPLSNRFKAWNAEPKGPFVHRAEDKSKSLSKHQSLHRHADFYWVKNHPAQIVLEVDNYLPAMMIINQLELITDKQLDTKFDVKYKIPSRKMKKLIIDCIPRETGLLQIQGLRYHIWSTNQEFRFADFPSIRQCTCLVEVVNELPILNEEYLSINNRKLELSSTSTKYNAQVHRGDDIFVTIGVKNCSIECDVNTLDVKIVVSGLDLTENIRIRELNLPILIGQTSEIQIDLSEIYDRYLARKYRSFTNIESLNIEIRLNYSNESDSEQGHYRRNTIELCLNYLIPISIQINDIQNDEDDLSYLMFCTIENYLSEDIIIEDKLIKPSESSLVTIKQEKIQLERFPSNLEELIINIRNQLPTHIKYKPVDSNKQLQLPIDTTYFSNEIIEKHANILLQSPFTCYWHLEKLVNTLQIHLCVISKVSQSLNLDILFPKSPDSLILDSNKILFANIQPKDYSIAKRMLIFSQDNDSNVIVVDVNVNEIPWKRLTLTF